LKLEIKMTDWADGIEIHNNGIKCVIDTRTLSELLRTIIAFGMIIGALLFYSWVRTQIVYTGYDIQKFSEKEASLLEDEKNLILTYETLTSPQHIHKIATRDLGMAKLQPNQIIQPLTPPAVDRGISNSLALVGSEAEGLKKSGESRRSGNYSIN
jgi:cell division protein FtsL